MQAGLDRNSAASGHLHDAAYLLGVALHEHAVGEGAAVALIGVAADVLLVALGFEHRAPLDASGEAGSPAATQTRGEDVGDNLLLRDRDSAGETAQAAVSMSNSCTSMCIRGLAVTGSGTRWITRRGPRPAGSTSDQ